MARISSRLIDDRSGAVAATVGLSLFALVAIGGIAFDYARLASLDSELQNAADQAALAAATQLDQQSGAIARATAAAEGLLANQTLMANDGNAANMAINITSVLFYAAKADAEGANGTDCPTDNALNAADAASNAAAKFVCVRTMNRVAKYALTPVVAAFKSGNVAAMAVAGLGAAICKTPPVMICNPNEGGDPSFTAANYIGKGLRLVTVGGGPGAWSAGNFGYLDTSGGSNGVPGLQEALGWVSPPGDCLSATGVDTKPGANTPATDAINTRFDIYDNGACQPGGSCPASINTVKDLVRPGNANGNNACRIHNAGWQEVAGANKVYLPDATNALTPTTLTPDAMGLPRDMCHAAGSAAANFCTGPIGTGAWDRDAYFRTNYGWATTAIWQTNTGLSASVAVTASNYASRANVYKWEIANVGRVVGGVTVLGVRNAQGNGANGLKAQNTPVCSNIQTPSYGTGLTPGGTNVDRRRFSVAVVNCSTGDHGGPVNGNSDGVTVQKWIEIFLVEPSTSRGAVSVGSPATNARSGTNSGDMYAEVISETTAGGAGSTAGQVVRRDVPYLVK